MKINRVELAAFGPFKDQHTIDFDDFADDGLFLIAGKTGAGKTSILDAICYGLYGRTPRYYGAVPGAEVTYRSHHAAPDQETVVTVEFTVDQDRYRVERVADYLRPSRRGGLTRKPGKAILYKHLDGVWVAQVAGIVQVEKELSGLLHLSMDQFLQVVLLAQNKFQEFLVASTESRNKVLQQLFATRRFEDYENELKARRDALKTQVKDAEAIITRALGRIAQLTERELDNGLAGSELIDLSDPASLTEQIAQVVAGERAAVAAAQQLAATKASAEAQARETWERAQSLRRRQDEKAAAAAELAELNARTEEEDAWQAELRLAGWAALVRPVLAARDQAAASVEHTQEREGQARALLTDLSAETGAAAADGELAIPHLAAEPDKLAAPDKLIAAAGRLAMLLGALEPAARLERDLPTLTAQTDAATAALVAHDAAVIAQTQQIAALQTAISVAEEQAVAATVAAAGLGAAQTRHSEVTQALAAAEQAERVRADLVAARAELDHQLTAATAAKHQVQVLWSRRIAEYAGTLASTLVPGAPCPVCGGVEHPKPAEREPEPVTQEVLDAAEGSAEAASARAEQAAQRVGETERQLGQLLVISQERPVVDWQAALAEARGQVEAAKGAAKTAKSLADQIAANQTELARQLAQAEVASNRRTELVQAEATALQTLTAARDAVEQARAKFASVAERRDAARMREQALRDFAGARTAVGTAQLVLSDAEAALALALAEHGFADADAAQAAQRSEAAQQDLAEQLRQVGERRAIATATLARPELADLPLELVDVEPAAQAVNVAQAELAHAQQSAGAAQTRLAVVADAAAEVEAANAQAGELRERFRVVQRLANTVAGLDPNERNMRLVDFVLAAELEEIAEAANLRLDKMSHSRYELHQDDAKTGLKKAGLGLKVFDRHTGGLRTTNSLSGGEQFLASLALALGLAEVVSNRAGGVSLDTLFIDEGFGALDPDTLEIAMATLDELRAGGRTVGVISHVPAMHEAIAAKLEVVVTDGGWSEARRS